MVIIVATVLLGAALAGAAPPEAAMKSFFLVASRNMPDPVFQKSVILMLPLNQPPLVVGVIINKPTNVTLGKLLRQPVAPVNRDQKVYFGGPVELASPLLVVRTPAPRKTAIQLWNDLYAVADPDSIGAILKGTPPGEHERLFLGRAQWLQEQLRAELLEGAWSVVPLRTDLIFEQDSAKVWPILSQHVHMREISARTCENEALITPSMCIGAFAAPGPSFH